MKKSVSRAVLAAAVVTALGMIAACGGSGDDKSSDKKSGAKAGTQQQAPLGEAELTKAALAKGDVKGFQIEPIGKKELAEGKGAKADKAECQPLADLFGSEFPKSSATVFRSFTNMDLDNGKDLDFSKLVVGLVRVSAYSEAEATKTVADLKTAMGTCKAGFQVNGMGDKIKIADVKEEAAPRLGDEALSLSAKEVDPKEPGMARFDVVRSGNQLIVVGSFSDVNVKHPKAPEALLKAQVAKVEKVLGTK